LLSSIEKVQLRNQLLKWRDKYRDGVRFHYKREIHTLFSSIDEALSGFSTSDLIFKSNKFGKGTIEPLYLAWITQETQTILKEAQSELDKIYNQSLERSNKFDGVDGMEPVNVKIDLLTCTITLAGGAIAIPAFASLSSISVGGWLGFIGLTTISWPIVITGIAISSTFMAFSIYKFSNIHNRAVDKYRKTIKKFIENQIFHGSEKTLSVADKVESTINKSMELVLAELDK
jgi:hypothetical protein